MNPQLASSLKVTQLKVTQRAEKQETWVYSAAAMRLKQAATDRPAPPLLDSNPPGKMFPQQQTRKKRKKESTIYVCAFRGWNGEGVACLASLNTHLQHTFFSLFHPNQFTSLKRGRGEVCIQTLRETQSTHRYRLGRVAR